MRILAGTSGWQYKEWKGSFYPEKIATDAMLGYYAERFPTVEVNNTFYRMPKESVLRAWADGVPDGFTFVLKASQRITHFQRLKEEAAESLAYLLRTASVLGDRLGPLLFQLPPNLKKDADRLARFLEHLPARTRAAFEFRHPSWLDDEVLDVLRAHDVALCIANTEDEETPFHATAGYGYLRLRKEAYGPGELEQWADRIRSQSWTETYVFFKHEDEGTGPKLARRFMEICG
jgi:uncharacterized protein YecE (DUF72 family)